MKEKIGLTACIYSLSPNFGTFFIEKYVCIEKQDLNFRVIRN